MTIPSIIRGTHLADPLEGTNRNDLILGFQSNDTLWGMDGSDTLDGGEDADRMYGGLGNDVYVVDHWDDVVIELARQGTDTVLSFINYTLGDHVENLRLLGGATMGRGNALNNRLTGNAADNQLWGNEGLDTLDGAEGYDTLFGGLGDDHYLIDSVEDVVVELPNEGRDTVWSSVSYTLANEVEKLVLTGTARLNGFGNVLNNIITGNSADNLLAGAEGMDTLRGGQGHDYLDGGIANDSMLGGTGDDTYVVDRSGDAVVELADEGNDTVLSLISLTLGQNVENLTLVGNVAVFGRGNALNNVLLGNATNNVLVGDLGHDTLNGEHGDDTMAGGLGDDHYSVNSVNDLVIELTGEGLDTVQSLVNYALTDHVENLTLVGNAALWGVGNSLNNVLLGNAANNTLVGGEGHDRLDGGAGMDNLLGGTGNDLYLVKATGGLTFVRELTHEGIDTLVLDASAYGLRYSRHDDAIMIDFSSGLSQHITSVFISGGMDGQRIEFVNARGRTIPIGDIIRSINKDLVLTPPIVEDLAASSAQSASAGSLQLNRGSAAVAALSGLLLPEPGDTAGASLQSRSADRASVMAQIAAASVLTP